MRSARVEDDPAAGGGGDGGLVVANDMDPKRAYMLATHTRRIGLPGAFLMVCDARVLPSFRSEGGTCFDRVLADVPCSVDGTLRKNGGIVKRWKCGDGLSIHPVQVDVCWRGLQLVKVWGYLCYSTCSMNPVENEAVVAEMLRRAPQGSLELMDQREQGEGVPHLLSTTIIIQ